MKHLKALATLAWNPVWLLTPGKGKSICFSKTPLTWGRSYLGSCIRVDVVIFLNLDQRKYSATLIIVKGLIFSFI